MLSLGMLYVSRVRSGDKPLPPVYSSEWLGAVTWEDNQIVLIMSGTETPEIPTCGQELRLRTVYKRLFSFTRHGFLREICLFVNVACYTHRAFGFWTQCDKYRGYQFWLDGMSCPQCAIVRVRPWYVYSLNRKEPLIVKATVFLKTLKLWNNSHGVS